MDHGGTDHLPSTLQQKCSTREQSLKRRPLKRHSTLQSSPSYSCTTTPSKCFHHFFLNSSTATSARQTAGPAGRRQLPRLPSAHRRPPAPHLPAGGLTWCGTACTSAATEGHLTYCGAGTSTGRRNWGGRDGQAEEILFCKFSLLGKLFSSQTANSFPMQN